MDEQITESSADAPPVPEGPSNRRAADPIAAAEPVAAGAGGCSRSLLVPWSCSGSS